MFFFLNKSGQKSLVLGSLQRVKVDCLAIRHRLARIGQERDFAFLTRADLCFERLR